MRSSLCLWLTASASLALLSSGAPAESPFTLTSSAVRSRPFDKREKLPIECSTYFGTPNTDDCVEIISLLALAVPHDFAQRRLFSWQHDESDTAESMRHLPRHWQHGHCQVNLLLEGSAQFSWSSWDNVFLEIYRIIHTCMSQGDQSTGGWSYVSSTSIDAAATGRASDPGMADDRFGAMMIEVRWNPQPCRMPDRRLSLLPETRRFPNDRTDDRADSAWSRASSGSTVSSMSRAGSCEVTSVDQTLLRAEARAGGIFAR